VTPHPGKRLAMLALCLSCALLFSGLGIWQVNRLAWKRDLIARVDARIHQAAAPLPPRSQWPTLAAADIEYRRVHVDGTFLHDRETLVDALTERGAGAWVLTPLDTSDGIVLVNRGFVPRALQDPLSRPQGQVSGVVRVTGLMRLTEPRGRVLRPNDPAAGRWFSRDVAAIAQERDLEGVAPFFIDAERHPGAGAHQQPLGGMTVVAFRNTHLAYAATWFALAALCIAGIVLLRRTRRWS
jgi:surfeit locus 1 family protein